MVYEKKGKTFPRGAVTIKQLGLVRRFGIRGVSWEQEGEGVLVDIFSQFVQDPFEVSGDVDSSFFEGAQDRHQNPPSMGASIRLGTKADLASNDGGSKISLGQVIFCRNPSVLGPMVQARISFAEDLLKAADAQVLGRAFYGSHNLRLNFYGFPLELRWRESLVA